MDLTPDTLSIKLTTFPSTLDSRYSFTSQFLMGAAMFSREAAALEVATSIPATDALEVRHRAHVAAAIMQAVAALESEIWGVCAHGPGHHLGSNGIDHAALNFLAPLAPGVDGKEILARYVNPPLLHSPSDAARRERSPVVEVPRLDPTIGPAIRRTIPRLDRALEVHVRWRLA